jgi:hypothetical protein
MNHRVFHESPSFSWITEFFMSHRVFAKTILIPTLNHWVFHESPSFSWITEFFMNHRVFHESSSFSWILKLRDSNKDSYEGVNKIVISCSIKESFKSHRRIFMYSIDWKCVWAYKNTTAPFFYFLAVPWARRKFPLLSRYVLNIYVGIVRYFLRTTKLSAPKSTYRHNAQIGEYRTILTSAKKIRFWRHRLRKLRKNREIQLASSIHCAWIFGGAKVRIRTYR